MEKIFNLLNKYNKNYLHKQNENKKLLKKYKNEFNKQGLYFKVNDDFDFIDFLVIKQSYENMSNIQNKFFQIKDELIDLWDSISYQEKHFLLYKDLNPFLDNLKSFYIDDKRYFISYFDHLINAYYDHDMLLFENEGFRKYLYDYKKIVSLDNKYNYIPLKSNFTHLKLINENENMFIMYDVLMKRMYIYSNRKVSVGLYHNIDLKAVNEISNFIINND